MAVGPPLGTLVSSAGHHHASVHCELCPRSADQLPLRSLLLLRFPAHHGQLLPEPSLLRWLLSPLPHPVLSANRRSGDQSPVLLPPQARADQPQLPQPHCSGDPETSQWREGAAAEAVLSELCNDASSGDGAGPVAHYLPISHHKGPITGSHSHTSGASIRTDPGSGSADNYHPGSLPTLFHYRSSGMSLLSVL